MKRWMKGLIAPFEKMLKSHVGRLKTQENTSKNHEQRLLSLKNELEVHGAWLGVFAAFGTKRGVSNAHECS